jgi:Clp amino terminal domain, pathogenicity island component
MATRLTLEDLTTPIDELTDASPLDRLSAAAATADELRGLSDKLLDRYVQAARADGRSWTEIGTALGVTKQAAHERFVDAPLAWPTNFNEPAREAVARAVAEARGFGHRYLGTEHVLLALTGDRGLAGAALAELGLSEHGIRAEIERIIGRGRSADGAALGITPRTKRVFETALKEAKHFSGQRCADTEHLLLALVRSDRGVAEEILNAHGADEERVRMTLATLIEREAPEIAAKLRTPQRRRGRRRARA